MNHRTLTYADLGLTLPEVYAALGYPEGQTPDAATRHEVATLLDEISRHAEPRMGYVTASASTLTDFSLSPIIEAQLRGCQAVCYFVTTAGWWYEGLQRRLMEEGDMLRVYVANEIGSLLAEHAADCLEAWLEQQLTPKGLGHTSRFSPGYCDWPLTDQRPLFRHLGDPRPCGIELQASCLMLPIKSVSGVIGIGHGIRRQGYRCQHCSLESCYKRRIRPPKA